MHFVNDRSQSVRLFLNVAVDQILLAELHQFKRLVKFRGNTFHKLEFPPFKILDVLKVLAVFPPRDERTDKTSDRN